MNYKALKTQVRHMIGQINDLAYGLGYNDNCVQEEKNLKEVSGESYLKALRKKFKIRDRKIALLMWIDEINDGLASLTYCYHNHE